MWYFYFIIVMTGCIDCKPITPLMPIDFATQEKCQVAERDLIVKMTDMGGTGSPFATVKTMCWFSGQPQQ